MEFDSQEDIRWKGRANKQNITVFVLLYGIICGWGFPQFDKYKEGKICDVQMTVCTFYVNF